MSRWKQWMKEPKGALPGGFVTKVGIALITVLVAGLLLSSSFSGPGETVEGRRPHAAAARGRPHGAGRSTGA